MSGTILLIGVGNEFRSDDAVGLLAAREFAARNLSGLKVIESTGDGASLMEAWEGVERVMIVDAISSGSAPGSIHRVGIRQERLSEGFVPRSSHAFGVAEAVDMARQIRRLPPDLFLYGIEGLTFDFGTNLSPPVAASLPLLIKTIERDLSQTWGH